MQQEPRENLTDAQRRRLEERQNILQLEHNTRNEKLKCLRCAFAIEAVAIAQFQLQQQVQAEESQIAKLSKELDQIERSLADHSTSFSPQTHPNEISSCSELACAQVPLQDLTFSSSSLDAQVQSSQPIQSKKLPAQSQSQCDSSKEQSENLGANLSLSSFLRISSTTLSQLSRLKKSYILLVLVFISTMTGMTSYACSQLKEHERKRCFYYKEQYEKNNPEVNKLVGAEGGEIRKKCNQLGIPISEY